MGHALAFQVTQTTPSFLRTGNMYSCLQVGSVMYEIWTKGVRFWKWAGSNLRGDLTLKWLIRLIFYLIHACIQYTVVFHHFPCIQNFSPIFTAIIYKIVQQCTLFLSYYFADLVFISLWLCSCRAWGIQQNINQGLNFHLFAVLSSPQMSYFNRSSHRIQLLKKALSICIFK